MNNKWENKIWCTSLFSYLRLFCVSAIREGMNHGYRGYGALILATACRLDEISKEEAFEIGKGYHSKCNDVSTPGKEFFFEEVRRSIEAIYKKKDVTHLWSCALVNNTGKCVFNQQQGISRAIEILLMKEPENLFYVNLKKQLEKRGSLTEKQMACLKKDVRKKICRV